MRTIILIILSFQVRAQLRPCPCPPPNLSSCVRDTCIAGRCVPSFFCNDDNPCTDDACRVIHSVATCINTPKNCQDGFRCTWDLCDASGNCVHGYDNCCCIEPPAPPDGRRISRAIHIFDANGILVSGKPDWRSYQNIRKKIRQ